MRVKCKNCLPKEGIDLPQFSQSEKKELTKIKIESGIKTVKVLMNQYGLSHLESKYIVTHINENYGKCNQCDYLKLDEENIICPKCKALNLNWIL